MDNATLTAAAIAITAQGYFSTVHEVPTLQYLVSYFVGNALLFVWLFASKIPVSQLLVRFVTLNITFLFTAIFVTLIRRLYFSPLSRFPGIRHVCHP